jgi:hypothetical protein
MASVSIYDQFYVFAGGILLAENQSVELNLESDDQDVFTIAKGFAGQTPSPKKVMASFENVIPPAGFEFDAFQKQSDSERVEMKFQSALTGKSLTSEGFIRKAKISAGVGKTTSFSFEFHGGAGIFS